MARSTVIDEMTKITLGAGISRILKPLGEEIPKRDIFRKYSELVK